MELASSPIAVCGLDCTECNIFQAAHDPAFAQRLTQAFKARGRADAKPEWFQCQGCRGNRGKCWSDDCWIWQCCVGERGLDSCHRCGDFPCARLTAWAAQDARYTKALERLKSLVASA